MEYIADRTRRAQARAEQRVGKSLSEYFAEATAAGLSQSAMAAALGVSRITVMKWLHEDGYRTAMVIRYTRKEAA